MRTHSALHVLCGVVWRDHAASVTGGNMEPLSGRMDFEFETMAGELVGQIETRVNEEIDADRDIRVAILPREEAFAIPDLIRTKINLLPEGISEIRTIDGPVLALEPRRERRVRSARFCLLPTGRVVAQVDPGFCHHPQHQRAGGVRGCRRSLATWSPPAPARWWEANSVSDSTPGVGIRRSLGVNGSIGAVSTNHGRFPVKCSGGQPPVHVAAAMQEEYGSACGGCLEKWVPLDRPD
jgi:hypothetical protein